MGFPNYPTKRKGVKDMQKQTIQFATVTKNGVVQRIGKARYYSRLLNMTADLQNGLMIQN